MDRLPALPFPPPFFPPPQPPPQCRDPKASPSAPLGPGGVTVIDDRFECSQGEESHGSQVTRTLRQNGFQGNIRQVQGGGAYQTSQKLNQPNLPPEQTRKELQSEVSRQVVSVLNGYTSVLDAQSKAGVKNSVVNISGGLNKADITRNLIPRIFENPVVAENVTKALGVDMQKLQSKDPNVSGPEMRKFQQGLVDLVNRSVDGSPEVKKARQQYDTSVRRFESNRNSVVVSVGNTGGAKLHPDVKLPSDFHESFNINADVTPVGVSMRGIGPVDFSAREKRNVIYTEGHAPGDNLPPGQSQVPVGTSFAAPRISGLMAELHRRYPHLSSSQIENLMRQQLTDSSRGYTEVDPQRASQMMKGS